MEQHLPPNHETTNTNPQAMKGWFDFVTEEALEHELIGGQSRLYYSKGAYVPNRPEKSTLSLINSKGEVEFPNKKKYTQRVDELNHLRDTAGSDSSPSSAETTPEALELNEQNNQQPEPTEVLVPVLAQPEESQPIADLADDDSSSVFEKPPKQPTDSDDATALGAESAKESSDAVAAAVGSFVSMFSHINQPAEPTQELPEADTSETKPSPELTTTNEAGSAGVTDTAQPTHEEAAPVYERLFDEQEEGELLDTATFEELGMTPNDFKTLTAKEKDDLMQEVLLARHIKAANPHILLQGDVDPLEKKTRLDDLVIDPTEDPAVFKRLEEIKEEYQYKILAERMPEEELRALLTNEDQFKDFLQKNRYDPTANNVIVASYTFNKFYDHQDDEVKARLDLMTSQEQDDYFRAHRGNELFPLMSKADDSEFDFAYPCVGSKLSELEFEWLDEAAKARLAAIKNDPIYDAEILSKQEILRLVTGSEENFQEFSQQALEAYLTSEHHKALASETQPGTDGSAADLPSDTTSSQSSEERREERLRYFRDRAKFSELAVRDDLNDQEKIQLLGALGTLVGHIKGNPDFFKGWEPKIQDKFMEVLKARADALENYDTVNNPSGLSAEDLARLAAAKDDLVTFNTKIFELLKSLPSYHANKPAATTPLSVATAQPSDSNVSNNEAIARYAKGEGSFSAGDVMKVADLRGDGTVRFNGLSWNQGGVDYKVISSGEGPKLMLQKGTQVMVLSAAELKGVIDTAPENTQFSFAVPEKPKAAPVAARTYEDAVPEHLRKRAEEARNNFWLDKKADLDRVIDPATDKVAHDRLAMINADPKLKDKLVWQTNRGLNELLFGTEDTFNDFVQPKPGTWETLNIEVQLPNPTTSVATIPTPDQATEAPRVEYTGNDNLKTERQIASDEIAQYAGYKINVQQQLRNPALTPDKKSELEDLLEQYQGYIDRRKEQAVYLEGLIGQGFKKMSEVVEAQNRKSQSAPSPVDPNTQQQ